MWPDFSLANASAVLAFNDASKESAQTHSRGSSRAVPPESAARRSARITEWAKACGRYVEKGTFRQRLDGRQVDHEIAATFRETPEFGRSIAHRLADFHDTSSTGDLSLIGAGGEAVAFFEPPSQRVIKLLGGVGKAGFGWILDQDPLGNYLLHPGDLGEAVERFALAEQLFPTGLEIEAIGADGEFILLSQPFLVGPYPSMDHLASHLTSIG
ncbi:MAG: hypothetical protein AAF236_03965 [Verrucomicrobiota bacterium]